MKTSSAPPPLPPRKPGRSVSPWVWVLVNQLAFPGLGTIMMGRKMGYAQAAIMLLGFFLTMGFLGWFIACSIRYAGHPEWSEPDYRAQYQPYLWSLYWGLGLCALSWIWALFSSWQLLRQPGESRSTPSDIPES